MVERSNSDRVIKASNAFFTPVHQIIIWLKSFFAYPMLYRSRIKTLRWCCALVLMLIECIIRISWIIIDWCVKRFCFDLLLMALLVRGIKNWQAASKKDWRLRWDGIVRVCLFTLTVLTLVVSCFSMSSASALFNRTIQSVDEKIEYLNIALEDSTTIGNLSRLIRNSASLIKEDSAGGIRSRADIQRLDAIDKGYTLRAKFIAILVLVEDCSNKHVIIETEEGEEKAYYSGITGVYPSQEDAWDGDIDALYRGLYEGSEQDLELFKPVLRMSVIEATIDSFQIMEQLYKAKKVAGKKKKSSAKKTASKKKQESVKRSTTHRKASARRHLLISVKGAFGLKSIRNSKGRVVPNNHTYRHVDSPSLSPGKEPFDPAYRTISYMAKVKNPKTGKIETKTVTCSDCEEEYIRKFYRIAQKLQQEPGGVPASIRLAQGLLESNSGKSRLAREGNNHFGIKGTTSLGYLVAHDDRPSERFRKYARAEDCMRDHQKFLSARRYAGAHSNPSWNYVGWANELNRVGYATIDTYGEDLIGIIERLQLYEFNNPNFQPY